MGLGWRTRFESVDRMLERYVFLCSIAYHAGGLPWIDPRESPRPPKTALNAKPRNEEFVEELSEISACIARARLEPVERTILSLLYRPRFRWCTRCQRSFRSGHELLHCPKCGTRVGEGFGWEPLPTLTVLSEEMQRQRIRERWYAAKVRRFRDSAYGKLGRAIGVHSAYL